MAQGMRQDGVEPISWMDREHEDAVHLESTSPENVLELLDLSGVPQTGAAAQASR